MKNIGIKFALGAALLAALATVTNAGPRGQGMSGGMGMSADTPGHQMRLHGSVSGRPGASGYAPGRKMQLNGSVSGHPGASGYAPGHLRKHRPGDRNSSFNRRGEPREFR